MSGQLILPAARLDVAGPLIFLAGPIQGAVSWQTDAARLIQDLMPEMHIANPRRDYLPGEFDLAAQFDWESHYLRRAAAHGAILFWLAREADHRCDRSYAQTTRFELAEWKVRHEREGSPIVVGIEEGFSGARYIRHRFAKDCPEVPIASNLADACRAAVKLANHRAA